MRIYHRVMPPKDAADIKANSEESIEPRSEKTVFGVSDQVLHKPGCTATEDG